ncbi:unnamed protein product [Owenia fusiformis]|uniref:RRP15-like protein n=1 Tax=Owenia fusiformis TaxID=6347 RepID=A0A8S4PEI8_OWEFU|nr:unnamed protein product [Owenia fusiformis]
MIRACAIKNMATSGVKVSYESSSSSDENDESDGSSEEISDVEDEESLGGDRDSQCSDKGSLGSINIDLMDTTPGAPLSSGSIDNDIDDTTGGMADVLAKIIGKKSVASDVILSKGQTDKERFKSKKVVDKNEIEVVGDDNTVIKEKSISKLTEIDEETLLKDARLQRKKKRHWENMCHVKPDITRREQERKLQRIATRGVVQLFNAVRKQQKILDDKLEEVGSSVRKQEKAMKSVDKRTFIDVLKGTEVKGQIKSEIKQEKDDSKTKKSWSVLSDNFMMGAQMKDWDKDDHNDEHEDNDEMEHSDSE